MRTITNKLCVYALKLLIIKFTVFLSILFSKLTKNNAVITSVTLFCFVFFSFFFSFCFVFFSTRLNQYSESILA